jgi:hypothetical protein
MKKRPYTHRLLDYIDNESRNERLKMANRLFPPTSGLRSKSRKQGILDRRFKKPTAGELLVLERFAEVGDADIEWAVYIGKAIRHLRQTAKERLTQAELARRAARKFIPDEGTIDQTYVSRVESGAVCPGWKRLSSLAHALGTTVSHIIWEAERAAAHEISQA